MAEEQGSAAEAGAAEAAPQISVQRIYLKDLSFESPQSPDIFRMEWKPNVKMDLSSKHRGLGNDLHEVTLAVTVTVEQEEKAVFLIEVQQAGIFLLSGLPDDALRHVLGTFCPEMLFPYVRETVDSLVVRGSFPALMLAPVNFEALFAQSQQQQAEEAAPH